MPVKNSITNASLVILSSYLDIIFISCLWPYDTR